MVTVLPRVSLYPQTTVLVRYDRIGVVGVTEASVVIAVSSPHRRDALDAVNFAIEELKARNGSCMIRSIFYYSAFRILRHYLTILVQTSSLTVTPSGTAFLV